MRCAIAAIALCAISATHAVAGKSEFTSAQNRFMEFARVAAEAGALFGEDRLIDRIELIGKDTYRVGAGPCTITATLEEVKDESADFLSRFMKKTTGMRNYIVKTGPINCSGNP